MIDWVPVVFVVFKALVFGTGMFFAIKWHYDQSESKKSLRVVLRTSAVLLTVFVLLACGLVLLTLAFARWMGMDLQLL